MIPQFIQGGVLYEQKNYRKSITLQGFASNFLELRSTLVGYDRSRKRRADASPARNSTPKTGLYQFDRGSKF